MDFLVIKVAQQLDVDFMFEPTIWLEPISYPSEETSPPVQHCEAAAGSRSYRAIA
jgi:hypothetical protein